MRNLKVDQDDSWVLTFLEDQLFVRVDQKIVPLETIFSKSSPNNFLKNVDKKRKDSF